MINPYIGCSSIIDVNTPEISLVLSICQTCSQTKCICLWIALGNTYLRSYNNAYRKLETWTVDRNQLDVSFIFNLSAMETCFVILNSFDMFKRLVHSVVYVFWSWYFEEFVNIHTIISLAKRNIWLNFENKMLPSVNGIVSFIWSFR